MTLGEWNEYGRLVIADMEENQAFRREVREALATLQSQHAEAKGRGRIMGWVANVAIPAVVAAAVAWFAR